jgi:arylformamidase
MAGNARLPEAPMQPSKPNELLLRGLSPRQIAHMIRGLDSRLVSIDYQSAEEPVLLYRFEVAGKTQGFSLVVRPESLFSIVDLYPEAAARERELARRFGLSFQLPEAEICEMPAEHAQRTIYDLSLTLTSELPIFPGEPGVSLTPVHRIAQGQPANVSRLAFGTHTGTHLDAPQHFFEGAPTVADLPIDILIGPALVVELDAADTIGAADLARANLPEEAHRLLFKTRNSALLHQPTFTRDFVSIDPSAADWLVRRHVRLVGLDYLSVERFGRQPAQTHLALLGAGVVIVEGLNLLHVPAGEYTLICLPLKVPADGCPVRAVLLGDPALKEGR